ncbi:MAG: HD-GYP domain-containing protein [Longimicrobiales bacterium]
MPDREKRAIRRIIVRGVDETRELRGTHRAIAVLAIIGLLFACGVLIALTGGTRMPYTHALYIPIVLAAFLFRAPGGLIVGIVAGLIAGPWMPLDAATAAAQSPEGWLMRTAFFCAAGITAGELTALLDFRLRLAEEVLEELSRTYARTLRAFAATVARRDENTGGHCERVALNARALGEELGLDADRLETLYWAALLHDFGKISVIERILLKPGRLTEDEYRHVQLHATIGADLVAEASPAFAPIAEGIRTHHERWDGTGYPRGLSGEDIPLFGRILAVVDVFEALTSDRPYRPPHSPEFALRYIRDHAGTHFDPRVVGAFGRLSRAGRIVLADGGASQPAVEQPARFSLRLVEAAQIGA